MSTSRGTRRDPMTDVLPIELLEVAHILISRGQNELYWSKVPVPKRPVGQVRYEVARQIGTFVVPMAGLGCMWFVYGVAGLLFSLAPAWLVGYLMDLQLKGSIEKKVVRDHGIDAGRYRAVKWLSAQTGLRPDEITLPMIQKMDSDYLRVKAALDRDSARRAEARKTEQAWQSTSSEQSPHASIPGAVAIGAIASAGYAADGDDDYRFEQSAPYAPAVNPANGLPMVFGTQVDVAGNVFGTDAF